MDARSPKTPSEESPREAKRREIWESLPPEIQANPDVRRKFGLGDAVEVVAKPVARAFGIKDCAPCQRRKAALNAAGQRAGSRIRRFFRRRSTA